jgi:hypothetical protein
VAGPDVPAAEIATMTLAEIYAEQGFKSKALDIFRQVRERSPHVEGIDARIEAIEAELDRVQREVPMPPEASLADLEPAASQDSPVAPPPVETESVPSPPLTAPESTVQEEERERRDHFRTWLERLKTDES